MNKGLVLIIAIILVAAGAWYWYGVRAPEGASTPPPPPPPVAVSGETYDVLMNASGFTPANLSIKAGDTVRFVNQDARTRWPASGVHPTHQLCAGFDALKPLATGESYSYTFAQARECPMHDHLLPNIKGKITVTP